MNPGAREELRLAVPAFYKILMLLIFTIKPGKSWQ